MHTNLDELVHPHLFQSPKPSSEKRTFIVFWLTVIAMFAEIIVGYYTHSMALYADGWHMGTHAIALGLSSAAYYFARKHSRDQRYAFGTWKIEVLSSFTSAIILGFVGLTMIFMSLERLIRPESIDFNDAIVVAIIGLTINLVSAFILASSKEHAHHGHHHGSEHSHTHSHSEHDHAHEHDHSHVEFGHAHETDLNLRAAIIHVVSDALTSVLAIGALFAGKFLGWNFLDPLCGILGAILILNWTYSLLKETTGILLDKEMDSPIVNQIRETIESDKDAKITDLHVWRIAPSKYACILVVARRGQETVLDYKVRLASIKNLIHITIEIHRYS